MKSDKLGLLESYLSLNAAEFREQTKHVFDSLAGDSPIVLFGAGSLGQKVANGLRQAGVEPIAFTDNNQAVVGNTVMGLPVLHPADAALKFGRKAIFVVAIWRAFGSETMADRHEFLSRLGCEKVTSVFPLFWKYPDLLPHCGADEPYKVLAAAEQVRHVLQLWSDADSKREFIDQILWRLAPHKFDLSQPTSRPVYFPDDVIHLTANEVFVDVGGYDGDTAKDFLKVSGGRFEHLYILEPDHANYSKIDEWVRNLSHHLSSRITSWNLGASDTKAKVRFAATSDMCSHFAKDGGSEVSCDTLDNLLCGKHPTFIKMDIEGAELRATQGASEIVRACRPILAICLYHAQSHIWEIPSLVDSMAENYQFHLKSHMIDGWESLLYAVPSERQVTFDEHHPSHAFAR